MALEDTVLDAPATPAPIFAYRALRGMFFSSPEDSPVPEIHLDQKFGNSEPLSPSRAIHGQVVNRTTPSQKRKRVSTNMLSPTKSCLRTPGAHTPRRVMLKDISVTFKDLRKSISPELLRKGGETLGSQLQENRRTIPKVSAPAQTSAIAKTTTHPKVKHSSDEEGKVVNISSSTIQSHALPTTTSDLPVDIQAYMSIAEQDMKKLIRYSQKMRDYARKQDEENAKLKELIAELRTENKRLRHGSTQQDNVEQRITASTEESSGATFRLQPSRRSSTTTDHKSPSTIFGDKPSADKATVARTTQKSVSLSTDMDELLNLDRDHRAPHQGPRSERKYHSIASTSQPTALESHTRQASAIRSPKRHKTDQFPRIFEQRDHSSVQRTSSTTKDLALRPITNGTTSTRLAPDRLAAARARIKKRSEQRKASADFLGNESGIGIREKEESGLDWVNL